MKPDRWTSELDQITNAFKDEFGSLSEVQLNWKANPQQWSVAQNIHHLIVVNESYYPVLQKIRNNTYQVPWFGRVRLLTHFIGKTVLGAVQPDRKKKMNTFPIWEPVASSISGVIKQFEKHQNELKELIACSQSLIEKEVVISSPANRMIVYKLETAFDIMVAHEKRHFEQARETNQVRIASV